MASSPVIVSALATFNGDESDAMRGDEPGRPWLGLDLDSAVPAGVPLEIGVRLHGAKAGAATTVEVKTTPVLPGPAVVTAVGDGAWSVRLPPPAAGEYRVKVTAADVPTVDQVWAWDVLGVVDGEA